MPNEVAVEVTDRYKPGGGFDTAKKKADEVGKSVKNIGQIAAGIIAAQVFQDIGRVAVRAFTDTLKAASGLEQAVGGTKAVFGEASKSIDLFAKNSAQATGLSERDFREMTTLVGGQLKRMTGDLGFATESSVKLTEVAADLAATYGGTTKQAMNSFAAALRGEADPAERFNLNLKASAVNAKAVALGLAESTGKVDESARAQAVYALILEQSADAQGQFAREADTAAVAQQKANAALENAQATIGQELLPFLASAATMAANMAMAIGDIPGPVLAVVASIGGLAAAALLLGPRLLAVVEAMQAMGFAGHALNRALGIVGAALTAAVVVLGVFSANQAEARARSDELTAAWDAQGQALTELGREQLAAQFASTEHMKALEAEGFTLQDLIGYIEGDADATREFNKVMEEGSVQALIAAADVKNLHDEYAEGRDRAKEIGDATAGAARSQEEMTSAVEQTAAAYEAAQKALTEYADAQRAATDPVFAMIDALDSVDQAQGEYNDAVKEYGAESPEAISAAVGLTQAVAQAEQAALDGSTSYEDFKAKLAAWVRQGVITQATADAVAGRVDNARESAEDYAGPYAANIIAQDSASVTLQRIRSLIAGINSKTVTITTRHNVVGGTTARGLEYYAGRAGGGLVGAGHAEEGGPRGGMTLVGEQGPELLNLAPGTNVIPAGQTQAMLSSAGGAGPIHVTINAGIIGSQPELYDWLVRALGDLNRRGRLTGIGA